MKTIGPQTPLTEEQREKLIGTLKMRFEKFMQRHPGTQWSQVEATLGACPGKLASLDEMEHTGGEPDVVGVDKKTGEILFFDCSPETPKDRTSLCYDRKGWESRKEHQPKDNAMDVAAAMGIEILTEGQYRHLQSLGEFDRKTSSWLKTPPDIRKLGGAIFGDRRYGQVFIYHNGAQSYYGARGFRGCLRV